MKNLFFLLCLPVFFMACNQQPPVRHYQERTMEPVSEALTVSQVKNMGMIDPHAGLDMSQMGMGGGQAVPMANELVKEKLSWKIPPNWMEGPKSAMRLASFRLRDNPKAMDCSVISLGGVGGGLEANLERWLGQIGGKASSQQMQDFMKKAAILKTATGQDVKVFDFSQMQQGAASEAPTIVVAMFDYEETTVFVKMKASIAVAREQRKAFEQFVQSISQHESN